MKKHDRIDDLFARKLSSLERTPSPDLWQRIEKGQRKESRRLGGWYWYAAASVTILLMAGYLLWQGQMQAVDPPRQMARTEQVTKPEVEVPSSASQTNDMEVLAGTQRAEPVQQSTQPVVTLEENYLPIEEEKYQKVPQLERTPILEGTQIAKVEKTETNPEKLVAKNKDLESLQSVEIQVVVPDHPLPDLIQKRVVVAHVETEELPDEAQKSSKFLRVLRQLKNAKQGDEVEWDELGFNPKRILARADERLRNGEDKVSDKYQELKNKTKL